MTDPAPRIDFANLPAPAEGILVTLFITVRKVARSRDFYSRILGGSRGRPDHGHFNLRRWRLDRPVITSEWAQMRELLA